MKSFKRSFGGDIVHEYPSLSAMDKYGNPRAKLGVIALFMFHSTPEQDFIVNYIPETGEVIEEYDCHDFIVWLGGVVLNSIDLEALSSMNREYKTSFDAKHGWRPRVEVKYSPTDTENDHYAIFETAKLAEEWDEWETS